MDSNKTGGTPVNLAWERTMICVGSAIGIALSVYLGARIYTLALHKFGEQSATPALTILFFAMLCVAYAVSCTLFCVTAKDMIDDSVPNKRFAKFRNVITGLIGPFTILAFANHWPW